MVAVLLLIFHYYSQPSLFHFYFYLMDRVRIHLRLESKPRNTWIQLLYTNLVLYWELAKLNEQEGNQFEDRLTVIDRWAWYPSQNGLLVNIRNRIQWGLKMYSAKLFSDYERGVGNSFDYWLPTVNSSWLTDRCTFTQFLCRYHTMVIMVTRVTTPPPPE